MDAQSEQDKPIFIARMVGIGNEFGSLVGEDGLRLFKPDAVLLEVGSRFCRVPLKTQFSHGWIITTM